VNCLSTAATVELRLHNSNALAVGTLHGIRWELTASVYRHVPGLVGKVRDRIER